MIAHLSSGCYRRAASDDPGGARGRPADVPAGALHRRPVGGAGRADTLAVVSPSTEEVVGEVPLATDADIDRAVAAARTAFDDGPWPRMAPAERADVLARAADLLRKRADDIAGVTVDEMGCAVSQATAVADRPGRPRVRLLRRADPHLRVRAPGRHGRPRRPRDQRAGRRGRRHRPVERPGHPGVLEGRPGAGRRLHRGAQAAARGAAEQLRARRGPRRGRRAGRASSTSCPAAARWASTSSPTRASTRWPSPARPPRAGGS